MSKTKQPKGNNVKTKSVKAKNTRDKSVSGPPNYKGVTGKVGKKQREAIDAVTEALRDAFAAGDPAVPTSAVNILGYYARTKDEDTGKTGDRWTVNGVAAVGASDGVPIGVLLREDAVDSGDTLFRVQRALETYGVKPSKKDAADPHAAAKAMLRHAVLTPSPAEIRHAAAYLLWAGRKMRDATVPQLLASRPAGFYGETFKSLVEDLTAAVGDDILKMMDGLFNDAAKEKPLNVYRLTFKGYDPKNPKSAHLVKTVAADAAVLPKWFKKSVIFGNLVEDPLCVSDTIEAGERRDKMLRAAVTQPKGKGGVDAVVRTGVGGDFEFDKTEGGNDPAPAWIKESVEFAAAAQERQDQKYKDSPAYGNVEGEILVDGESKYKGRTIRMVDGRYTSTGQDRHENLLNCMRAVDAAAKEEPVEKKGPPKKPAKKAEAESSPEAPAAEEAEAPEPEAAAAEEPKAVSWPDSGPVSHDEIMSREEIPWGRVKLYFVESADSDPDKYAAAVERMLLTPEQRERLAQLGVSPKDAVWDAVTGRPPSDQEPPHVTTGLDAIFTEWNDAIGRKLFQTRAEPTAEKPAEPAS